MKELGRSLGHMRETPVPSVPFQPGHLQVREKPSRPDAQPRLCPPSRPCWPEILPVKGQVWKP